MKSHDYKARQPLKDHPVTANIQAVKYTGSGAVIQKEDWAACDEDGGGGTLTEKFLEHAFSFPVNRGAGLAVEAGQWIIRNQAGGVAVLSDDIFQECFCPVQP